MNASKLSPKRRQHQNADHGLILLQAAGIDEDVNARPFDTGEDFRKHGAHESAAGGEAHTIGLDPRVRQKSSWIPGSGPKTEP